MVVIVARCLWAAQLTVGFSLGMSLVHKDKCTPFLPTERLAKIKFAYKNEHVFTGTNEQKVLCLFSQAEEDVHEMSAMWVWEDADEFSF